MTGNSEIFEWMCGLKIDFILELFLEKVSTYPKISAQEFLLVTKEVESMLKKGAIQKTSVEKCQFLSKLFLVVRKNGGSRPVISIKNMNASILYLYFKMEGLHLLKFMLKVKNYMCKIELKNAYICNPLHWQHQKYIRLGRSVLRIRLSMFWPGTSSTVSYKATENLNSEESIFQPLSTWTICF